MHASPSPAPAHGRVPDVGRLLLGLSILTLGVLFLLGSADVIDAGQVIDDWWPAVIVGVGVVALVERPPAVMRGLVLMALGAGLLLFTTGTVEGNAWDFIWPAAIIVTGLVIVAHWSGRAIPGAPVAHGHEIVRSTAILGGPNIVCTSTSFRGAWLTAILGGISLDLRAAELAPEGAAINATVAFGGVEILVPKGWRIDVRATPILGGVDDKTDHSVPPAEDAPTLRIDAVAVFGGVDIKTER
jgi:hypothetical protein